MKLLLLVVLPLLVFGLLFSGGFTNLPKLRPTPYPTPQDMYSVDTSNITNIAADKDLQIRTLPFIKNAAPPPPPINTPPPPPTQPPPPPSSTCSTQKVAVDMLLDISGSMNHPCLNTTNNCQPIGQNWQPDPMSKIAHLKTAVLNFLSKFQDGDLIAIQTFNSGYNGSFVPLQPYTTNRAFVDAQFSGPNFQAGGFTWIKDALEQIGPLVVSEKNARPDYNWALIFLTDGFPEDTEGYYQPQDPTIPTDITASWKNSPNNLRIISIGYDHSSLSPADQQHATSVIQKVASQPLSSNVFQPSVTDLDQVYNSIASSICR